MRQRIEALLLQGKTYNQIVAELGCAKSTVAYHAKNVKEPPNYKVHDWDAVQKFYDEGHRVRQCLKEFGIARSVWYHAIKTQKLTAHEDHRIPLSDLTSPQHNTGRSHLKMRLIDAGILRNFCAICGINKWHGKPISLQLHHVNGVNNDNRIENLQLLCPNCHSQTENYSGRNTDKTKAAKSQQLAIIAG